MDETSTTALFSCIEAQLTIVQRLIDRILQHGIEYGSGDPKSSPVQLLAELKTLQLCLLRVEKVLVSCCNKQFVISYYVLLNMHRFHGNNYCFWDVDFSIRGFFEADYSGFCILVSWGFSSQT